MCSLHSIKSTETRIVKVFSTKTSTDVGMVQCSYVTFVPAWKYKLVEKLQVQGEVPFHATTHAGQHSLASRHFGYAFTIPSSGNILMHQLPAQATTCNKLHWCWLPKLLHCSLKFRARSSWPQARSTSYSTHMHCAITHQLMVGLDSVEKWPLANHPKYHTSGNFGEEFILADWQFWEQSARISICQTVWCHHYAMLYVVHRHSKCPYIQKLKTSKQWDKNTADSAGSSTVRCAVVPVCYICHHCATNIIMASGLPNRQSKMCQLPLYIRAIRQIFFPQRYSMYMWGWGWR